MQKKVAEAMGRLASDAQATFALNLAGIAIRCSQVQRIGKQLGSELVRERDPQVVQRRRRERPVRVPVTPDVVAAEVDGGRLRTRAGGPGPGVQEVQGKEDKVACLTTPPSQTSEHDPEPEPPPGLLQPRRVRRLVQQMKGAAGEDVPEAPGNTAAEAGPAEPSKPPADYPGRPRKVVRTCVAGMASSDPFGPMVAAEAQERGFYEAMRKAFVADGASGNWSIHRGYFSDFEPITDFLHARCYVSRAAWGVGGADAERWSTYEAWLRAGWQGRVGDVIEELQRAQGLQGVPPEDEAADPNDPRRWVTEDLTYLTNNRDRMDYPRYRRLGLPITSSLVESLVGEFNARVKSRPKYWNRPDGAEPILQLRAAVLSEDDRLDRFFDQRPGHPYRSQKAA